MTIFRITASARADIEAMLADLPAIQTLIAYASAAPAHDPGEGDWESLESTFGCGERAAQYEAAKRIREALTALGLAAPEGDDPVLMEAGGGSWKWTAEDQYRAQQDGGWELTEFGDGQVCIVADDDEAVFTGVGANLEADAHVRAVAASAPKGSEPGYVARCARAVFIAGATLAEVEAEALEADPGLAAFAPSDVPTKLAPDDPVQLAREGVALLAAARERFKAAGSTRTLARVSLAISSGKGAVRAAGYRKARRAEGGARG